MRHILCNYARDRQARKRGGDHEVVEFDNALDVPASAAGSTDGSRQLLALDSALARLNEVHPRRGRVVECRFFGGMTVADTASALGVSPRTVKRDWAAAQKWLQEEIERLQASGTPAPSLDELAATALPPLLDGLARSVGDELRPGQRVSKYEIVTTLGRGGMGIVYKGYDTRLDRHRSGIGSAVRGARQGRGADREFVLDSNGDPASGLANEIERHHERVENAHELR